MFTQKKKKKNSTFFLLSIQCKISLPHINLPMLVYKIKNLKFKKKITVPVLLPIYLLICF